MHIEEMRELKAQLVKTRDNNDALRHQLEERITQVEEDAKRLFDDPASQRVTLVRDNDEMRQRLADMRSQKQELIKEINELKKEKKA